MSKSYDILIVRRVEIVRLENQGAEITLSADDEELAVRAAEEFLDETPLEEIERKGAGLVAYDQRPINGPSAEGVGEAKTCRLFGLNRRLCECITCRPKKWN